MKEPEELRMIRQLKELTKDEEKAIKQFLLNRKILALQAEEEEKRKIAEEQLFDSGFDDMESYR